MKRNLLTLFAVVSILVLVLAACGGGKEEGVPAKGTGKAVLAISDAAADLGSVTSIQLTVDSVKVHKEGGAWTTVSTRTQTYDLLELRGKGTAQLLAQADLQAGSYDQMELSVSKVVVVDSKGQQGAKLPSNKLQIKGDIEVKAGATATANFDFIADQSLHLTGEGRYILSPVIKLETKENATAQVQANNEVTISGGTVTTDTQVGMDVEGSVDAGLRIAPDAVLTIAASGKIIQTKGQALVVGTVKAVDTANGTVTLTTKGGSELVLHLASDSAISVRGSQGNLAALSGNIGAEVMAKYNAETKAAINVAAAVDSKAKANLGSKLELSGTIKSVDTSRGTVTITADSGAEVVLKVAGDSKLNLAGISVSGLVGLTTQIGARVATNYNASTGAVGELQAESEKSVAVTGTLKAVDVAAGTITVTTQAGTDVVLNAVSSSKVLVNGSLATLATLKGTVGSEITAQYTQRTRVVGELNARGQAQGFTTVTGTIKAVNPENGTVTIQTAEGKEIVLDVTASSSIVADGTLSALVNLATKVGSQVAVEYDTQTKTATNVSAQAQANASITGTLRSVDVAAGTITISAQDGSEVVLKVAAGSQTKVEGAASTLASLAGRIGSRVTAEFNAQTKIATNANVHAQSALTITGTLKSVNAAASTVTITTQAGVDETLTVGSDTKVLVAAAPTTLAALATRVGSQVTAEFNALTKAAATINAQAEVAARTVVSGTLRSVDLLAGTVTVAAEGGQQVTVRITSAARVLVEGAASSLLSLTARVDSQVTVEYNPQTNIATQVQVTGRGTVSPQPTTSPAATPVLIATAVPPTPSTAAVSVSGTLKAVNILANQLTIAVQGGADLVLTVNSGTVIRVGGTASSVAALAIKTGSGVTAQYNAQTRVATSLEVQD
jgi:hypothetical protein